MKKISHFLFNAVLIKMFLVATAVSVLFCFNFSFQPAYFIKLTLYCGALPCFELFSMEIYILLQLLLFEIHMHYSLRAFLLTGKRPIWHFFLSWPFCLFSNMLNQSLKIFLFLMLLHFKEAWLLYFTLHIKILYFITVFSFDFFWRVYHYFNCIINLNVYVLLIFSHSSFGLMLKICYRFISFNFHYHLLDELLSWHIIECKFIWQELAIMSFFNYAEPKFLKIFILKVATF